MGVRYDIMRMSEKIQCPGCGLRFHDPRRVAAGKLASSRMSARARKKRAQAAAAARWAKKPVAPPS